EGEVYKITCENLINLAKNSGLDVKKSEAVIDDMIEVVKKRLDELSGGEYAVSKVTAAMIKDKIGGNLELLE
ncbi:hypothetical protein, partial [Wohlfahrtiimonas chitiniclastica]|uniref:hypothetical protein n=1 Tax=Wohlfahrtiimonas chitiniclastica TaxID=400946 RepID=UPI0021572397